MKQEKSKRLPLPDTYLLKSTFSYNKETGEVFRDSGSRKGDGEPCGTLNNGYLCVRLNGVLYMLHRLIWKMETGEEPMHIDHINGIRTDNRLANLRPVSRSQNNRNIGLSPRSTSGYAGVTFVRQVGKWRAHLRVNRRKISGGEFSNKIDAVLAFNSIALLHHGEYALRRVNHNLQMLKQEFGDYYEQQRT
ncbi:HNH endonuclease [Serratia sp. IR-2025]